MEVVHDFSPCGNKNKQAIQIKKKEDIHNEEQEKSGLTLSMTVLISTRLEAQSNNQPHNQAGIV